MNYTKKDLAEELGVSLRTIQRQISAISKELETLDNKCFIPSEIVDLIKKRDKNVTKSNNDEDNGFDYIEAFTSDEYIEFQKRINEYPILKEYIESLKGEIDTLRFNLVQQIETIKTLTESIHQRNYIEAKEKGI